MKLDRKGFMLAEVVVVSVVVATVLITLYAGLSKVSSAYSTRNRYYDVDSLYVAMEENNIILRYGISLNGALTSANNLYTWAYDLNYLGAASNIQNFETFYYDETGSQINVYITPYDKDVMLQLKSLNDKLTFSDYLDYLSESLDFSDGNYNYMIIVERIENNDNDDCYYYALKLKY